MAKDIIKNIAKGKKQFGRVNDMYAYAFKGKKVAVKRKVKGDI